MTSHSYEIALYGGFQKGDLKPVLNRIALHSESAHQMHTREVLFDPPDAALQREANQEPALLRAKKELLEPDAKWVLYSYWKPESARTQREATVRPWATVQVVGDALGFASALGFIKRTQIFKRGYVFRRGRLVIQIFQEEQTDPNTQDPIPAHEDMPWQVIVRTANPVPGTGTQEIPLGRHIEAVVEVQALMKGLLDLRRQDA